MSAPVIWILIPGLAGVFLFLMRRWSNLVIAGGIVVTGLLTVLAWQLPIDDPLQLGPLSLKIANTLTVLGRRFVLLDADRPLLVLIYGAATLWFLATFFAEPGDLFIPVGLGVVGFLTAALAVSPFLFAALFIEIAALLSVPLLAAPGQPVRAGVMRFLIYQTLGAPFILFTGWLLAGVEASPSDIDQVIRAAILLAIGFAFLLAIIPFHTWIVMLAEKAHPFRASFIFVMMPGVVSLFGLGFLDRFAWLRTSDTLYQVLSLVGFLMVGVGGLWASFQRHLGRVMGYAVVMEIGLALLAISVRGPDGLRLFFGLFLPRIAALLIWSVALTLVRRTRKGLMLSKLGGLIRESPLLAAGLLCGPLTLAGLPLLPGFPVRLALFASLAEQNFWLALGAVIGTWGLVVAVVRTILALLQPAPEVSSPPETDRLQDGFFVIGLVVLLVFGVFPGLLSSSTEALAQAFNNIMR